MKSCKITITTSVDGMENTITRKGEMELFLTEIRLRYEEENALVSMNIQGERAQTLRKGDYELFLDLKSGETTKGRIGIGGSHGEVDVFTHKISYSVSKDSLLLSMRYYLIIGGEKQEMNLRLLSRFEGEKA